MSETVKSLYEKLSVAIADGDGDMEVRVITEAGEDFEITSVEWNDQMGPDEEEEGWAIFTSIPG